MAKLRQTILLKQKCLSTSVIDINMIQKENNIINSQKEYRAETGRKNKVTLHAHSKADFANNDQTAVQKRKILRRLLIHPFLTQSLESFHQTSHNLPRKKTDQCRKEIN